MNGMLPPGAYQTILKGIDNVMVGLLAIDGLTQMKPAPIVFIGATGSASTTNEPKKDDGKEAGQNESGASKNKEEIIKGATTMSSNVEGKVEPGAAPPPFDVAAIAKYVVEVVKETLKTDDVRRHKAGLQPWSVATVAEDTPLAMMGPNLISVKDVDGNLASTQLTVTQGTVKVTLSGAATISAGGNGTSTLTISGTKTDINATLASLIYKGTLNYNGPDMLTTVSTDSAGTTLSTDVTAITVTAVN